MLNHSIIPLDFVHSSLFLISPIILTTGWKKPKKENQSLKIDLLLRFEWPVIDGNMKVRFRYTGICPDLLSCFISYYDEIWSYGLMRNWNWLSRWLERDNVLSKIYFPWGWDLVEFDGLCVSNIFWLQNLSSLKWDYIEKSCFCRMNSLV